MRWRWSRSGDDADLVRVRFHLDRDADGWPPADSEGLWARPSGAGTYVLENCPWFVRGVAAGDEVAAVADGDGVLWATERVRWGGRQTIRVIPFRDGPLEGDLQRVLDEVAECGATGEGLGERIPIVALDLGPETDLATLKAVLRHGDEWGWWEFEEGCVTDEWLDL
jgi:hypothetical protein